jgi:hypothetical protein
MSIQHLLKASRLSDDMIERRDLVRRLYGDRYDSFVETPKTLIRSIKQRKGGTTLSVGLELAKKAVEDGHGAAVTPIVAAVVDMVQAGES